MKSAIALILLSMFSLSAHAGMHKWVDTDGQVHYSDTLPPDTKAESVRNMLGKGQQAAPVDYSPKSYVEREAELRKSRQQKQEADEKAAREAAQKEERKHNCSVARENLRALEEGTRLVTYDENGERRFLDDDAREQRLNDARNAVKANCD